MDQMIALLNGDLSVVDTNNLLRTVTEATTNNTKALGEVIKRIGQLSDAVVATEAKVQSWQVPCVNTSAWIAMTAQTLLNVRRIDDMFQNFRCENCFIFLARSFAF
ncbi:MAG: hypothetical protein NWF00_09865 [Candidatus Bathyarchaeota archaeon]|nr:hypothetical protein [Candidatus Bathyarchaeota archaeon]